MSTRLTAARILGIDPGTNALGFGIIEIDADCVRIMDTGTIRLGGIALHQEKLREIYLQLQDVIEAYLPATLAIEAPFYGKNVQSMLKLGRAQGVAIAAGITMGLEVIEYSPKKVKQAVTGNGNAAKEQVAAMLYHLLGVRFEKKNFDASDALAVAYCHYQHRNGGGITKTQNAGSWKQFIRDNPGRISSARE